MPSSCPLLSALSVLSELCVKSFFRPLPSYSEHTPAAPSSKRNIPLVNSYQGQTACSFTSSATASPSIAKIPTVLPTPIVSSRKKESKKPARWRKESRKLAPRPTSSSPAPISAPPKPPKSSPTNSPTPKTKSAKPINFSPEPNLSNSSANSPKTRNSPPSSSSAMLPTSTTSSPPR